MNEYINNNSNLRGQRRHTISCIVLIGVLLLLFFAGSAGGTSITFDKAIDIPARNFTVTYEGSTFSFTIEDIGNYKIGDDVGVTVNGGVNNMRLVLFTVDKLTPWFKTFYATSGFVSTTIPADRFDSNCPDVCDDGSGGYKMGPGIYALAVQNRDNSNYFIAKPVIVSDYDITTTPSSTQNAPGSTVEVTVQVFKNGIPVNVDPNNVTVEFVQDSTNKHFSGIAQETSSTGVYEANIPIPLSASGNYRLYAAITTNRNIYQDYQEIIGAASYSGTITISSSIPTLTPTPTPTSSPVPTSTPTFTTPSSEAGGGGGGTTSGEPYENILKKESREELLAKDLPAEYMFTTPELPVSEIQITSTTNAGIISTQVELLKNVSKLVNESAPGVVYKYVDIWVGTPGFAVPKNIKEATIKFKVDNSWLVSGGLKDTDAVLLRWDGSQWNALETQMINKDENFTYYQAKTYAFSPFVISVLTKGITTSVTPSENTPTVARTPSVTGVPSVATVSPINFVLIIGLIIIIVLVAVVYIKRKKISQK